MRTAIALIVLLLATPVWAGFDEGKAAYDNKDYVTALREWRPLAEQGDARAQNSLGHMYDKGKGVSKNYVKAAEFYTKAANQGLVIAQWRLGTSYEFGRGVPKDYILAYKWYNLAAGAGDEDGIKDRNFLAKRMTSAQIAEAQKLAREWWAAYQKRKRK